MEEYKKEAKIVLRGFVCHVANEEIGHGSGAFSVESAHSLKREMVFGIVIWFMKEETRRRRRSVWNGGECEEKECDEEEKSAN
ncbi:hypothetical protein SESBI_23136 [Sesbania bispinosa]|nr:hypothetical protein SESBI_23136 [Sesbania bispinosa]